MFNVIHRNTLSMKDKSFKDDQGHEGWSYRIKAQHRLRQNPSQDNFCNVHGRQTLTPSLFKTLLYNDKYRIVYCAVPKIACTNWKRVFLILSGNMNTTNLLDIQSADVHGKYGKYLTSLSQLPIHKIKYRLDNYYKFMFTRNPFERVLSAYLNKFKSNNPYFHSRYGKQIVKRFRIQSPNSSLGNDVTFLEYVQYLTDYTRRESFNEH